MRQFTVVKGIVAVTWLALGATELVAQQLSPQDAAINQRIEASQARLNTIRIQIQNAPNLGTAQQIARDQLEAELQELDAAIKRKYGRFRQILAENQELRRRLAPRCCCVANDNYGTRVDADAEDTPASATISVTLPADAELWIDDIPTTSVGPNRSFVSPPLQPGQTYYYALKARIVDGGETVSRRVPVRAGEQTEVVFGKDGMAQTPTK